MFLYGAGLSNPNLHAHTDLPLAVVGGAGGMRAARHLIVPIETADDEPAVDDAGSRSGIADRQAGRRARGRLNVEPLSGV